jgi:hypothetical protein
MRSEMFNGGAFCRTEFVAINKTATAGGSGDATEVDGAWIDRIPASGGVRVDSAKLVIAYTATLAQGATLKFGVQFQDATSSGGAGAADFSDTVASTTVATGPTGGGTVTGTVEIDINLGAAREFFRAQITPDLSAANTDTCEWAAMAILFDRYRSPQTKAIASIGGPK